MERRENRRDGKDGKDDNRTQMRDKGGGEREVESEGWEWGKRRWERRKREGHQLPLTPAHNPSPTPNDHIRLHFGLFRKLKHSY